MQFSHFRNWGGFFQFLFLYLLARLIFSIWLLLSAVNDQGKSFRMKKIKFLVFSAWCRGHDGRSKTGSSLSFCEQVQGLRALLHSTRSH